MKMMTTDLQHRIKSFCAATPSLLNQTYREQPDREGLGGHCYAASEAYFHSQGGYEAGYTVHRVKMGDITHWFLKDVSGTVIDLTSAQFDESVPYDEAIKTGFLTGDPSKRAQRILDSVRVDTTEKTVIGFDVDGVLANQNEAFCQYIEDTHGIDYPVGRVDERNPYIPEIDATYVDQIRAALKEPEFYKRMSPVSGAVNAVQSINNNEDFVVAIVTHRDYKHAEDTVEWLDMHDISHDLLYVNSPDNKGELDIDVLIDDYPSNAEMAASESCEGIGFITSPHLDTYPVSDIVTAVNHSNHSHSDFANDPEGQWNVLTDYIKSLSS